MKILMLGWELPPHNSGGLGVACYHMCKHLALQGVSIDFALPYASSPQTDADFMNIISTSPAAPAQLQQNGYGAYDSTPAAHNDVVRSQFTARIATICRRQDYDAIHAHEWLTFEAGMQAKALTGKPLIAHVHATEFDRSGEFGGNPLVHDIEYNGLMIADHIIAVSAATKRLIVSGYGIPASKIEVVHNSIDPAAFAEPDDQNAYRYLTEMKERGYQVVVSLGRLTTQKGLHYLLHAAQKVVAYNNKVLFLIAGDGDLRHELLEVSAQLGISQNIIFTGFVRGKHWRDTLAIGDIFVMSSVSEPFGLSALEAASYHNALLLTQQSGVGEILQNVIRYDYWDTVKLADAILTITAHPSMRQLMADGVKRECQNMSWSHAAAKCRTIYQSLAKAAV